MTSEQVVRTGIAIVMPAYHYGSVDGKSHCTVAFLGSTEEVDFPKYRAQRIVDRLGQLDLWRPQSSINTFTTMYAKFGVEKDIPVGILHRDERIFEVRERAEQLMYEAGIEWSNDWQYTPHVTLYPNINLLSLYEKGFDMNVMLRPPVLWWGEERPASNVQREPFHVI